MAISNSSMNRKIIQPKQIKAVLSPKSTILIDNRSMSPQEPTTQYLKAKILANQKELK